MRVFVTGESWVQIRRHEVIAGLDATANRIATDLSESPTLRAAILNWAEEVQDRFVSWQAPTISHETARTLWEDKISEVRVQALRLALRFRLPRDRERLQAILAGKVNSNVLGRGHC